MFDQAPKPTYPVLPEMIVADVAPNLPSAGTSKMETPIVRGAPLWLTGKNMIIGTGIGLFMYLAYVMLLPRKKSAVVSGIGWIFSKRRRRRR